MVTRLSIRLLTPLLFGIPVLALGVWLSVMWRRQSERALTELAEQHIEQIHDRTASKIADMLSMPVRVCKLNEHLVSSSALDPADLHAWQPTLVKQAKAFDLLSAIVWGDADGRSVWVCRYSDGFYYWAIKDDPSAATMSEWRLDERGGLTTEPTSTFEFDLLSRPWFQTPRDAKSPCWSEPFVWVGGGEDQAMTLGISYGIPLYHPDGRFQGIVDADYSLNDLSTYLGALKIGKTGIAFLATSDSKLLAASNDSRVITPAGERVESGTSDDERVLMASRFVDSADPTLQVHAKDNDGGNTDYVGVSHVGHEVGLDWVLITIIPKHDFTGEIEAEFRRSSMASLIAVFLAVVVGLASARWLVTPLTELVTAVRRIGQGDLETRVHIRHAPEYTNLATEINGMASGLQDRMRMQKSLSLAMEVQRNLLPSEAPIVSGLDIAGHSLYCDETGGDYFDFLEVTGTEDDSAAIAVGDVMGHGVAAALLMATARGMLRSRCAIAGSLADFLIHINDMLVVDTQGERFMTMLLVTVSADRDEIRWASAGHDPPIIYDPASDKFPELEGGGLPLGLEQGESYLEYTQPGIVSGSIILASTDGLTEAMNEQGEMYGTERLRQLLQEHASSSANEISQAIRNSLAKHRGPLAQDDDLTFVVARVL